LEGANGDCFLTALKGEFIGLQLLGFIEQLLLIA